MYPWDPIDVTCLRTAACWSLSSLSSPCTLIWLINLDCLRLRHPKVEYVSITWKERHLIKACTMQTYKITRHYKTQTHQWKKKIYEANEKVMQLAGYFFTQKTIIKGLFDRKSKNRNLKTRYAKKHSCIFMFSNMHWIANLEIGF